MVSIFGSNYFFPSVVAYLSEFGYPAPVALTTLNQFSELFFMAHPSFLCRQDSALNGSWLSA